MIGDGYLVAAFLCSIAALLVGLLAWRVERESRRLRGYREWLKEGRLP